MSGLLLCEAQFNLFTVYCRHSRGDWIIKVMEASYAMYSSSSGGMVLLFVISGKASVATDMDRSASERCPLPFAHRDAVVQNQSETTDTESVRSTATDTTDNDDISEGQWLISSSEGQVPDHTAPLDGRSSFLFHLRLCYFVGWSVCCLHMSVCCLHMSVCCLHMSLASIYVVVSFDVVNF